MHPYFDNFEFGYLDILILEDLKQLKDHVRELEVFIKFHFEFSKLVNWIKVIIVEIIFPNYFQIDKNNERT